MRAAVFSDTHRFTRFVIEAINRSKPDMIIHLGDHDVDADELRSKFPEIPVFNVRGNCDFLTDAPETDVVSIGPVKAFITHGHLYNVKYIGPQRIAYAAAEAGARIAMFGHTHIPMQQEMGDVIVMNPGTAGKGSVLSWALVDVQDDGTVSINISEL